MQNWEMTKGGNDEYKVESFEKCKKKLGRDLGKDPRVMFEICSSPGNLRGKPYKMRRKCIHTQK